MKYKVMHTLGCGRVAFYYDHYPEFNEPVQAKFAFMEDGSQPEPFEAIKCCSCGMPYYPNRSDVELNGA